MRTVMQIVLDDFINTVDGEEAESTKLYSIMGLKVDEVIEGPSTWLRQC